jgi:essential nuclear protein 1
VRDAANESKMTRRILSEARKQQQEEEGQGLGASGLGASGSSASASAQAAGAVFASGFDPLDVDDDVCGDIEEDKAFAAAEARAPRGVSASDKEIDLQLTKQDERDLAMFVPDAAPVRRNLADVIMEKLRDQGGIDGTFAGSVNPGNVDIAGQIARTLDPKVVAVYTQIGKLLTRYTHGKLPKAFKVLPALRDWEEVMYLTSPERWSPNAVREATRLFASNLNARMAQRFYALVLLPRVLEDYADNKRLNFHFYYSLQKALYKPAAFFKGCVVGGGGGGGGGGGSV